MIKCKGVGRTVYLVGQYAIKVPSVRAYGQGLYGPLWTFLSGWLANLSEWEHRAATGVAGARLTLFGLVSVYPRCEPLQGDASMAFPIPWSHGELMHDVQRQNIGWLNEEVVFLDYDQRGSEYYLAGRRPNYVR
jgi:hypothetical protein